MAESKGQTKPMVDVFYDAFKSSPIGIVLEDLEGRPLFVNPAFCSMLGFSEEEILTKHCVDFSPAEDAEKDWSLFQQLRAGSIDHYHLNKRYFRRDGSLVWGRLSISLLNHRPSPLVIAMVEDITEKMVAQETLEIATKEMVGVTRCSRDFRYLWVSRGYARFLRRPLNEIVGRPIVDVLGKDVFEALSPYFERALAGEKASYEAEVSFEGIGRRWISASYIPAFDPAGNVNGWVGIAVDVTDRKRAEAIVSSFSQRLIQAQEQERATIGRELHDDVNQRIALAMLHLDALISEVTVSSEAKSEITGVIKQLRELAGDIQALSYRLHSSKLEQLGLRGAAASFCREVSAKHKVKIEFQSKDIPESLPHEISLCLFRVMQEALQNSTKHSGSTHFQVSLTGGSDEVQLMVKDSGKGFDPQEALNAKGIGLASMKQRLKLVNGQLSIQTEPGHGTAIFARVPFHATSKLAGG
jgi:PAS domain S-box-containing protein